MAAGELRREDVGIGFDIDYPKLEKLDTAIDKVLDNIDKIGHEFEPVNQQMGAMGRNFADTIDKMLGANRQFKESNQEVSKSIQNNSRVTTTFRDKIADLNRVTDSYTGSQAKQYHEVSSAVNTLTGDVGTLGRKMRDLPKESVTKIGFDANGFQSGTSSITGQLKKVDKSMDKTAKKSSRLKDIIVGSFAGNLIANGVGALTNGLHEATQAGMEYNKEQDTMKTVWTSLTTEAPKDGKNLVKFINDTSQHSIYAAGTLDKMAQSFYHVHSNEKETKNWTNDFVALGSTLHMTNDSLAESGEQFAKIVAGGKASAEDMSVMINRFPMFGEALQKATGKSMKQLYAMSAAGKMTATQFTEALTYLGKKYRGGTKEAMTSFMGMSMYIKSRFSKLSGDVMNTSFKMSKDTAKSMRDLLSDDMMQKYANGVSSALGVATSAAVKGIDYLDKHKKTILDVLGTTGDIAGVFAKQVWKTSTDILYDMGDAFGLIDSKGKKAKDPLDQLNELLQGVDKHKAAIRTAAKAMVGFFVVKKATEFLKLIKEINTQLKLSATLNAIDSYGGILGGGKGGKRGAKGKGNAASEIETAIESGGTTGGRHFAKEAKKGGVSAGKSGGRHFAADVIDGGKSAGKKGGGKFSSLVRTGAKKAGRLGGGLFSDAIHNIAWMAIASKFASDGSKVFLDGITTSKGSKAAWKLGGDSVGAAIGYTLGGPAGAAAGMYIGGFITDSIRKLVDKSSNAVKQNSRNNGTTRDRYYEGNGVWIELPNGSAAESSKGPLNPSGVLGSKKKSNKKSKPKISVNTGIGHASGGPIVKNGLAMVGEAGTEIGYDSRKGTYQIFNHGPQLVHLKAGMHILNARDSAKAMHGGLGRNRVLPGYAAGTVPTVLPKSATKGEVVSGNDATLKNTEVKTKRTAKKISKDLVDNYSNGTKKSKSKVVKFGKDSNKVFKQLHGDTADYTGKIRKQTVSDFDDMQKGSQKQANQLQKGLISAAKATASGFGDAMGKLKPYSHKAMSGAISELNGGISGIDTTLGQFGGNHQVLKPIHYAKGSNGPIASDQMAVLNDSKSGPRQELVGRGDQLLKPIGNDVVVPLKRGDSVFNGSQVERAKPYLPHFAKGTGASDSKLKSLAKSNAANPGKAFNSDFTLNVKLDGSDLRESITNASKGGSKTVGVPWTGAMYNYIESLINGSGGGGPVLHSPGAGWHLTSGFGNRGAVGGGFSSHDGNDFSGAKIVRSMQDSVVTGVGGAPSGWGGGSGIGEHVDTKGGKLELIYQELNGKSNSGAKILVHKGEHVKQGQPLAELGPSGTHVHVGASTQGLWSHGGGSTRGWLDVTKLNGDYGGKSSKKTKTSSALTKLVTQQLGKSASKWISDHLADDAGGPMGNPGGSGVSQWRSYVKKALGALNLSTSGSMVNRVLRQISTESGGNPKAMGGTDGLSDGHAEGLMQVKPGTFAASKLAGHGYIWNGYDNILAGLNYAKKRYGKGLSALGNGHGYENGGFSKRHQMAEISEGNKLEAIVPMSSEKSGRRKELMKQINAYTGDNPAPKINVSGKAGGHDVTIKMTNHITIQGGASSSVGSQVESSMSKVGEQLVDMIRRAVGTDQGEGGLVI